MDVVCALVGTFLFWNLLLLDLLVILTLMFTTCGCLYWSLILFVLFRYYCYFLFVVRVVTLTMIGGLLLAGFLFVCFIGGCGVLIAYDLLGL